MLSETRRELAERVLDEWEFGLTNEEAAPLLALIEAVLKDRDERAAKIAVDAFFTGWPMHYTDLQKGACITAAIRNIEFTASTTKAEG